MTPIALAGSFSQPANDQTTPLRILLGEDNETMRRLVGFVLRSDGHVLTEAQDGKELLERLPTSLAPAPEARIDAIISEQSLPAIQGPTILARFPARRAPAPLLLPPRDP